MVSVECLKRTEGRQINVATLAKVFHIFYLIRHASEEDVFLVLNPLGVFLQALFWSYSNNR